VGLGFRGAGEQGSRGAEEQGSRGAEEQKLIQNRSTERSRRSPKSKIQNPKSKIQNPLARGSARSVNNIDLYELVKSQEHLLHRFGGHPYAAGLSLPVDNIPLFTEAINQQLRQKFAATGASLMPVVEADLVVNVAQLGKELFQELKLLEPCGMGNPAPKLLIQNCWFENVWNRNTKDVKGRKIQYIKTELEIWDDSATIGFPGIWWGHYKDEVPKGRCNALVELDFNNYKRRSEVRIIALEATRSEAAFNLSSSLDWILDWRGEAGADWTDAESPLTVRECPTSWDELQVWFRRAIASDRPLAIAYPSPKSPSAQAVWQQLIGIAKFLSRTGKSATLAQLHEKLEISDRALQLGLDALAPLGFQINRQDWALTVSWHPERAVSPTTPTTAQETIRTFLAAVEEEQFLRQYFYQVPLTTIQAQAARVATHESR
jgi:single-stranded-DNA-specific exonuclease